MSTRPISSRALPRIAAPAPGAPLLETADRILDAAIALRSAAFLARSSPQYGATHYTDAAACLDVLFVAVGEARAALRRRDGGSAAKRREPEGES